MVLARNIVTFLCGLEDPSRTRALEYFRADLPDNDSVLRSCITEHIWGDKDSVEHCAESMWERFEPQIGVVWRLRLNHGVLDQDEGRWVEPNCVPLTLSYLKHQHTVTFDTRYGARRPSQ